MLKKKEIFIAAIFFIAGIVSMYFYNWRWIQNSKKITMDLVSNYRETYEVQENLKKNYYDTYRMLNDLILDCIAKMDECKAEEIANEIKRMESERVDLNNQLEVKNQETQTIMSRFP